MWNAYKNYKGKERERQIEELKYATRLEQGERHSRMAQEENLRQKTMYFQKQIQEARQSIRESERNHQTSSQTLLRKYDFECPIRGKRSPVQAETYEIRNRTHLCIRTSRNQPDPFVQCIVEFVGQCYGGGGFSG